MCLGFNINILINCVDINSFHMAFDFNTLVQISSVDFDIINDLFPDIWFNINFLT
jgi:hypothetical protein